MRLPVTLRVNQQTHGMTVEPDSLLLDILRDDLGLMGANRGCESSYCGACSVLLDGKIVHSCSIIAATAQGHEVTTIEGLQQGEALHAVQEAFIEAGAIQCGYCTPGLVLATCSLLAENATPSEKDVREWLLGNICRCTGYQKIVAAVQQAAQQMAGPR